MGRQDKGTHLHSPGWQAAEQNKEEGEAWGQDKGIFVYQLLLPGASAREAKSGAKRHHNSSISDPAGTFILSFSRYSLCYRVAGSAPGASGENAEQREGNRQKQYNNKCKVTFPLPATAELLPGSAGRGSQALSWMTLKTKGPEPHLSEGWFEGIPHPDCETGPGGGPGEALQTWVWGSRRAPPWGLWKEKYS